ERPTQSGLFGRVAGSGGEKRCALDVPVSLGREVAPRGPGRDAGRLFERLQYPRGIRGRQGRKRPPQHGRRLALRRTALGSRLSTRRYKFSVITRREANYESIVLGYCLARGTRMGVGSGGVQLSGRGFQDPAAAPGQAGETEERRLL